MIKSTDINKNGHLTHMVAQDLFIDEGKQVFSAKTGKWLGTIKPGQLIMQEINFDQLPEQTTGPETADPNQISLFD